MEPLGAGSALVPGVVNSRSWWETSEKRACEEVSASLLSSLPIFSCVTAKGPDDSRTFPSVGICSFCCCLCPHRMFLSARCAGTSNYRAIHPHPRNFRQRAEKVCRWHWNRPCCRFCLQLKGRESDFLSSKPPDGSFIYPASRQMSIQWRLGAGVRGPCI